MNNKYKTFSKMEPYGGKYAKIKEKMKTDQTENVKKLTTSDDAYSPEKMYVVSKGMKRPKVQEETDLTAKKIADEVKGKAYFRKDLPERALREVMRREERKRRLKRKRSVLKGPFVTKEKKVMPEKLRPRRKLAAGGMAQRGLGRAFMKGGKV